MGMVEDQQAELGRLVDRIVARDQATLDDALDDFGEADRVAENHMPGHELYVLERYLRCLCVLALADFSTRRGVHQRPTEK